MQIIITGGGGVFGPKNPNALFKTSPAVNKKPLFYPT